MTEIKVGDKVRLTGHLWGAGTSPGQESVVEITDIDGCPTFEGEDGTTWGIYDGGWGGELVEPARRTVDDIYEEEYGAKELGVDPVEEGDMVKPFVELSPEAIKTLADAVRVNIEFPDAIDPNYYKFPGGVEVRQISAHLTGFGAQALQYIARSTRLDGNNKGDKIENLRKSIRFIEWEIERLEGN